MNVPPSNRRSFTLLETLATCVLAALAMALGAAVLSGARDPMPRAEQTFLELHAMARLTAVTDGPAKLRIREDELIVFDGRDDIAASRPWPASVTLSGIENALHVDRLGRTTLQQVELVANGRTLVIKIDPGTGTASRIEATP